MREIANNLTEEPFRWTAEALLALISRGILLAIVSKNSEERVREIFAKQVTQGKGPVALPTV